MRKTRNLKRLVALSAALLLVVAVAFSPGAAVLGAGATFAVVLMSTGAAAQNATEGSQKKTGLFQRITALSFRPPGRAMSDDNSTMVNAAATTATARRARKNHFETDMRYCGDRISMQNAHFGMATARGPNASGSLPIFMSGSADMTRSATQMFDNGQFVNSPPAMISKMSAAVHSLLEAFNIGQFSYRARDRGMMSVGLAA